MGSTVFANNRGVAHKGSSGTTIVFPDVCKTPPLTGPTPIPYPNTATTALKSQQTSQQMKIGGEQVVGKSSNFMLSKADEAGRDILSSDIKTLGSNVARHEALQLQNSLNQANARLQNLRTRDPNEWQKVLTDYAVLASALYRTLYPDD